MCALFGWQIISFPTTYKGGEIKSQVGTVSSLPVFYPEVPSRAASIKARSAFEDSVVPRSQEETEEPLGVDPSSYAQPLPVCEWRVYIHCCMPSLHGPKLESQTKCPKPVLCGISPVPRTDRAGLPRSPEVRRTTPAAKACPTWSSSNLRLKGGDVAVAKFHPTQRNWRKPRELLGHV